MLPFEQHGGRGPLLVLLHWLGGGAQTWREVGHDLAERGVHGAALDLPGFGEASSVGGYNVSDKVEAVITAVRALRAEAGAGEYVPWLIGGHSMGGKVAMAVARRALDGEPGLENLRGIVLTSPSTPSPEPMSDERRAEMLATFGESTGDPQKDRRDASSWVDHNTGKLPLPAAVRERAIDGVLAINRTAIRVWLETASREDWSDRIGTLLLPALVFTGSEETSLGLTAQEQHTLPHLPQAQTVTLDLAKHLAPLERPGELVEHITQFIAGLGLTLATPAKAPDNATQDLMHSAHTSPATLRVMEDRLSDSQDWNHHPRIFSAAEQRTLRALAARIVPNAGFDLAACIDQFLAKCKGDGWRFAVLPSDIEAWHRGLLSLDLASVRAHGVRFLSLFGDAQDDLIHQACNGKLGRGLLGTLSIGNAADAYSAYEMQVWMQDVRSEFTRFYIGDPRTMDRIGYTGFADDLGFTQIQIGQTEEFER